MGIFDFLMDREKEKESMTPEMIEFLTKIGYFQAEVIQSEDVNYITLVPPDYCQGCKLHLNDCTCKCKEQ